MQHVLGPSGMFFVNYFLFTNNVYITLNAVQDINNIGNGHRTQTTHTYVLLELWVSFFILIFASTVL